MEIAKIVVSGTSANVIQRNPIPSGLVGGTIAVEYIDEIWDDLNKTVVFQGGATRDVVTNENLIVIPHEVLQQPNKLLNVGFYGMDATGKLIIPTFYANIGLIRSGTDPSGDLSTDPTLPIWAQLTAQINDLQSRITALSAADVSIGKEIAENAQDIASLRADFEYVPIDITSISSTVTKAEMGSVINNVTISWVVNKTPKEQTLNGSEVAVNLRSVALTEQGITANKTFTVQVTDERNAADTASANINFLNGVYYGAAATPATLDSAFIRSLTKELSNTKGRTINVNAAEGKNIWYALPARLGSCNFTVGGFLGGFELVDTIPFTNASGYTESYYVYASAKTGLGETKVVVS